MPNILEKLLNSNNGKIKQIEKAIKPVEELAKKYRNMSDEELKSQTAILKNRLSKGETLDDILPEAFATVREASYRVNGEYPYHVQLIGGYVLHNGDISEQATGEGKTLTSVLPAYLNALEGKGVHIVTVNEYLAERDAEKNGKIHRWLGLTVGLNKAQMQPEEKRAAYNCDITYSTNSELGFDYLRDNMVNDKKERVMRGLNYAIIDEIDSILIDDARTPLIISGQATDTPDLYKTADMVTKCLNEGDDFIIDPREKICSLTENGITKVEKSFGIDNLYSAENTAYAHFIKNALQANYIMEKDVDYIVDKENQEVLIVDPNTGRTMKGRQWSNGLHQAVEAKEGIEVKSESKTIASITYQNFFRMYKKLSGISGTAITEEEEFLHTYNMYVVSVPTNKPVVRIDYPDYVFGTKDAKYKALVDEVIKLHKKGQPVLVGTVAIETSELISNMLDKAGVPHTVLNAKNHALEADIVSHAGEKGAVTIATNMAGRGTDIKLGEGVRELGGLAVIGTERHKSRRIDDQLRGRSGRQGDPGSSRFFVSVQDDLMIQFGSERLEDTFAKLGDEKVESKLITNSITNAQKRVEGMNFDARKSLLEYDDVLRVQRETIYKARDTVLLNDNIHGFVKDIFKHSVERIVETIAAGSKKINEEEANAIVESIMALKPETMLTSSLVGLTPQEAEDIIYTHLISLYETKIKGVEELIYPIERSVVLKYIDSEWSDHIAVMDELRTGIGLRSYAQSNPLQAYTEEGYELFNNMMKDIEESTVRFFLTLSIVFEDEVQQAIEKPIGNPANITDDEDDARKQRCCFTGVQLSKIDRTEEEVKATIDSTLSTAKKDGYITYMVELSNISGVWSGEEILKLKKEYPEICLVAVIPCLNFENSYSEEIKEKVNLIWQNADYRVRVDEAQSKEAVKKLHDWLVYKNYRVYFIGNEETKKQFRLKFYSKDKRNEVFVI